ncbi:MAG: glutamate 5-kinase [Nitrospirae bacterium]|nr:MAG: glutamate 5-kinase [Nitrospirota bacterium]
MRDALLTRAKRVVVKIGSTLVATRSEGLREQRIQTLVHDLLAVQAAHRQVVIVSSGAILAGIGHLGLKHYPRTLPLKQAAAAVGQSRLIRAYEKAFERQGQRIAQILLTHQDLADRKRFLNARHTLTALLDLGVIPIINENDTVSVDEIRFGDNDTLAGQVAHLIDADVLVILSDVDGLYSADPHRHPDATLIPVVSTITSEIERMAGPSNNPENRGGMFTKVQAAKHAAHFGVTTLILNGETPGLLPRALAGAPIGTCFLPRHRPLPSRKHWIAFTLRPKGALVIDEGAVEALCARGKSLLPSGILDVSGQFDPGDAVRCLDRHGKEVAKGLVNYSADTLRRIKGHRTQDLPQLLGTRDYDEVIHRDNLVLV